MSNQRDDANMRDRRKQRIHDAPEVKGRFRVFHGKKKKVCGGVEFWSLDSPRGRIEVVTVFDIYIKHINKLGLVIISL